MESKATDTKLATKTNSKDIITMISFISWIVAKNVIWCSYGSDTINIYDLQEGTAKKSFEGIQIPYSSGKPTNLRQNFLSSQELHEVLVQPIPDSDLLIALKHAEAELFANFGVYSMSQQKLLYNFDGAAGGSRFRSSTSQNWSVWKEVGPGGLSINSKKKIAALLPIQGEISYHLFDTASLEIIQKAKWPKELESKWLIPL